MALKSKDKSVGLVLSGGGVRGMAHIGLIQALEESGIEVKAVAGSSVGALVGALYCNGNSTQEMLTFFKETPLFKYNFFTINKPGLLDTDRYFNMFKTYFPEDSFEALGSDLIVVATNLEKGKEKVFCKGPLIRPLLASAALPPVFSPVEIEGNLYADGGIMNNFPKEHLPDYVNFTIGSNVSIAGEVGKKDLKNSFQLAGRITGLMIYASGKEKLGTCNIALEPKELENIGVLDKKGIEKAYEIGYDYAIRKLENFFPRNNQR